MKRKSLFLSKTITYLIFCLLCCQQLYAQINPGELVINELQADNVTTAQDPQGEFDDWIELYNNTGSSINLSGLFMTDDVMDLDKWALPNINLPANDYLIIWADWDTLDAGIHANFKLSSMGEFLYLGYANGTVVDTITFVAQGSDLSYSRYPNGTGNFGITQPTFNASNSQHINIDTIAVGELVINEFMANNLGHIADQNGEYDDWIELHNLTGNSLSLQYVYLTDDQNDPTKWAFPDTFIAANDYLIIWADDDTLQSGLHAYFGLATTGDDLYLGYADGTLIDFVDFDAQPIDISTGRYPNGTGDFELMPPTFSANNSTFSPVDTIQSGEVVINELMAFNLSTVWDQDNELDDWIEFYNNTGNSIDLNGAYLSDDPNDLAKWAFPDTSIGPNDYLIVWADQDVAQSGLHAAFNLSSTTGEQLIFGYPNGKVIDQVDFGPQIADTTFGRYPNGTGPFGFMASTYAANNSPFISIDTIQAGELVINELMALNTVTISDQDGEFDDWIEIYNNTANPISMSKVLMSDDSLLTNFWAFPDTVIGANSFLIVWADQDNNQDGLHANFRLNNQGETIFLGYSDGTVIDKVFFWPLQADSTFGRYPNGTGPYGYMNPTFSSNNSPLLTDLDWLRPDLSLHIYPNPSNGLVHIELSKVASLDMALFNPQGQRVHTASIHHQDALIWDLNHLAKGIYFLQVNGRFVEKIWLE